MALNYSHRPIFRSHRSEDNNVGHGGGSSEKDINDILPDDPFGMDISSTVSAITGWLEDLGVSEYGSGKVGVGVGKGHHPIFAGVNVLWNKSLDIGELNTLFSNDMFGGCVRYGCCAMEDVVFGCGNGCVRDGKNVGSYKSRDCGFGETLKRFVGDGGSRGSINLERGKSRECDFRECGCARGSKKNVESYKSRDIEGTLKRFVDDGCCTMKDVVFGCSDNCARNRNSGSVESHKNRDGSFGEFVMVDASDYFFGKNGLRQTMKDDIFGYRDTSVHEEKNREGKRVVDDTNDGSPHPAMSFALAYLGIRDLLAVERVCKSLRFTVQNDTLLWKSIQIDHPLNTRVNDAILLRLTDRAQGHLQCLSLLECNFVTNDGLRRILETNLRLTKLSVPGCINIKIEGIIDCLKSFQPRAITGINRLRVAGRPVTTEQFEELMLLLGIQEHVQQGHQKPYFYYRGNIDVSCEDDRPIDLEICPKCEMVKLIYDCTTETCQANDRTSHSCRACIRCINRCFQCGRCIDGVVHEEDFFFDYVCSDCLPEKSKCLYGNEFGISSSSEQSG